MTRSSASAPSRIMLRHGQAILTQSRNSTDLGMVENARAEIRIHGVPPLFKLYVLNNEERLRLLSDQAT